LVKPGRNGNITAPTVWKQQTIETKVDKRDVIVNDLSIKITAT